VIYADLIRRVDEGRTADSRSFYCARPVAWLDAVYRASSADTVFRRTRLRISRSSPTRSSERTPPNPSRARLSSQHRAGPHRARVRSRLSSRGPIRSRTATASLPLPPSPSSSALLRHASRRSRPRHGRVSGGDLRQLLSGFVLPRGCRKRLNGPRPGKKPSPGLSQITSSGV